jgi:hypothetical protein
VNGPVRGDDVLELDGVRGLDAALEIDVDGRWNALSLSKLLIPFRSYLVQHTSDHWVVHARAPGCHGEPLDDALRKIDEWHGERRMDGSIRVGVRHHPAPS